VENNGELLACLEVALQFVSERKIISVDGTNDAHLPAPAPHPTSSCCGTFTCISSPNTLSARRDSDFDFQLSKHVLVADLFIL
jgi:hypothetical protein